MVTRKMRMLAASLALVLCVSLYSVPRAKAVATEVAVGTAAVASYFQATGLTMAASAGSTGALVTTGVADIAGSYAMATGAASSGSAFLSSVATGVSLSPAGAIVLTAAAVVAIGALVAWYVSENGLDEVGSSVVTLPGTSDSYLYGDVVLPDIGSLWMSTVSAEYPYAVVRTESNGGYALMAFTSPVVCQGGDTCIMSDYGYYIKSALGQNSWGDFSNKSSYNRFNVTNPNNGQYVVWSSHDILYLNSDKIYLSATTPVPDGDVTDQLEVVRAPEFTQPDTEFSPESQKQMVIDVGFPAGTTLDTVATQVPELIASGNLSPTYEITISPGEGTDPEPEPEPELQPEVVSLLQSIKTTLTSIPTLIADSVMAGLQSLFVPDETFFAEAVPELQKTFQDRMGLLTFPISLLADFMGRLLNLSDQEPILRWNSVSIYGTELIAAGQYNLKDALKSAQFKQMYDIYMVVINAILIFAFLGLCHNKYRKIMQN